MDRSIDMETARTTFDEIARAAADDGKWIVIEQPGREPIVIARLPDIDARADSNRAVMEIQEDAKTRNLDAMTMDEIEAEIGAYRREKASQRAQA